MAHQVYRTWVKVTHKGVINQSERRGISCRKQTPAIYISLCKQTPGPYLSPSFLVKLVWKVRVWHVSDPFHHWNLFASYNAPITNPTADQIQRMTGYDSVCSTTLSLLSYVNEHATHSCIKHKNILHLCSVPYIYPNPTISSSLFKWYDFKKWTQSRFNLYTYYNVLIKGEKKEKHFSPVKENIDIMQYL